MQREDEFCQNTVVDASMVEQLCGDLANQGEEFELIKLVVGFVCHDQCSDATVVGANCTNDQEKDTVVVATTSKGSRARCV